MMGACCAVLGCLRGGGTAGLGSEQLFPLRQSPALEQSSRGERQLSFLQQLFKRALVSAEPGCSEGFRGGEMRLLVRSRA